MKTALEQPRTTPYEEDFYLWLMEQAELLRQGRVQELDLENLAEEVESIGRSDKREVFNRLVVLTAHLLKYQHQSEKRTRSWSVTIATQRRRLKRVLQDSPSLRQAYAPTALEDIYQDARHQAAVETRLPPSAFPKTCPYKLEQVLDEDFFPEALNG